MAQVAASTFVVVSLGPCLGPEWRREPAKTSPRAPHARGAHRGLQQFTLLCDR
ncbi:Hypothetical protein SMAX5B_018818 [Scophthalmus maximus]|uniref:Uncharacterized protein n=1 Tax=Scophthalmus maximus TaxID=52904 RepID=A0A2U9BSB8_SCOMX|nr:Hypothetical protein SMAX5B_018818 [Scophthalmus maximus]